MQDEIVRNDARPTIKKLLYLCGSAGDRSCLQPGKARGGRVVRPGAFLSPDSVINMLRSRGTYPDREWRVHAAHDRRLNRPVGRQRHEPQCGRVLLADPERFRFLPTFAITMVLGFVLGLLNGYLVMKLRITPVIATLVTLSLFKGIALLIVPDGLSAIKGSARKRCLP